MAHIYNHNKMAVDSAKIHVPEQERILHRLMIMQKMAMTTGVVKKTPGDGQALELIHQTTLRIMDLMMKIISLIEGEGNEEVEVIQTTLQEDHLDQEVQATEEVDEDGRLDVYGIEGSQVTLLLL